MHIEVSASRMRSTAQLPKVHNSLEHKGNFPVGSGEIQVGLLDLLPGEEDNLRIATQARPHMCVGKSGIGHLGS